MYGTRLKFYLSLFNIFYSVNNISSFKLFVDVKHFYILYQTIFVKIS